MNDLLKNADIIKKFSNPANHFKEFKGTDAENFLKDPKYKFLYGSLVEVGDKGRENLKLVAEELDIDIVSLFQMYEYVGVDSTNILAKVTKGQYQDDMGTLMVKPLLPKFAEEQANIYKILQIFITIRSMRNFGALQTSINDFIETLTLRHNLLANLWANYKSLWKKTAPKMFKSNPALFYISKLRQQLWILLAIFKGISTGLFKVDEVLFKDMFQTFKEQRFQGSFIQDELQFSDNSLAREAESTAKNIIQICALTLMASLRIEDIITLDENILLSNESMSYRILTKTSTDILKEIVEIHDKNPGDLSEIAHFTMAFIQSIESLASILEKRTDVESKNVHIKLIDVLRTIPSDLSLRNYENSIEAVFESHIYNYFTEHEKDMVKKTIKNMFILMVTPKLGKNNMLEGSSESEIEFISKILYKIIDSPEELERFWARFDPEFVCGNDYSMIYTNFLDMFPQKAELTFNITSHLLGGKRSTSYVGNVIDLFARMNRYTLLDLNQEMSRQMFSAPKGDSAETFELLQDFIVPNTYGFVIPRGTTFRYTENNSIKFFFTYNYWNQFWRSLTAVLSESRAKNIALSGAHFAFMKLLCQMVKLEPLQAPLIQLLMATPASDSAVLSDERAREDQVSGYAGLAIVFLDILSLCKTDASNIDLVLEVAKALNALMISQIGTEFFLVAQAYSYMNKVEGEDEDRHVLASVMDILLQKYYHANEKPAFLLAEMVQMVETILAKSEFLFEIFQSPEVSRQAGRTAIADESPELDAAIEKYHQLYDQQYWPEPLTKDLNRTFLEATDKFVPGTRFISCKLIENLLDGVLSQAMEIVNSNTILDFDKIPDVRYMIKARIFSVLNNLISRFRTGSGAPLLLNRLETTKAISLDLIIEYFNSINVTKFLMCMFDVEISSQGVFFGTKDPSAHDNAFGLENKSYVLEAKYAGTKIQALDAFQTCIIEATRCFSTTCDLLADYMKDPRIPASRLAFVTELSLQLLSPADFYKNSFSNFSHEYSANFFIMLLVLCDFNKEKGLDRFSRNKLHTLTSSISVLANPLLFFSDQTFNYPAMFADKINQELTLAPMKPEPVLRASSVSAAALQAMTTVLRLWRKANRASKPVLADLLADSQLSPHFTNTVFNWFHKTIIGHLSDVSSNSFEALAALRFISECLISQPTYFNELLKYCTEFRESKMKMSGLVYLIQAMVTDLEEMPGPKLFEEGAFFECLCHLMQLVANLYLRPSVRREVVSQLLPFVLPRLSNLLAKVIDQRKSFMAEVVDLAQEMLTNRQGSYILQERKSLDSGINILRIRYIIDQECNFCFSLASVSFFY